MELELKETGHSYYCELSNYYKADVAMVFDTWKDFVHEWLDDGLLIDDDYNHLFRFDIKKEEKRRKFSLELFFMLHRKGAFVPILIRKIEESDMPEISEFLEKRWEYMKNQWKEFSGA
jgi:hypothetical protein